MTSDPDRRARIRAAGQRLGLAGPKLASFEEFVSGMLTAERLDAIAQAARDRTEAE